jgi:hypothetical protein
MASKKKRRRQPVKPTVKKRTLNAAGSRPPKQGQAHAPAAEQDAKRRLGDFTGAGEHARVGSRTAGIVGQTKRAFRTDNKRTKSRASYGKPDKAR